MATDNSVAGRPIVASGRLISVELINARDKTQMRGEHYKRKAADFLQVVQEKIARTISEKLRIKLTGDSGATTDETCHGETKKLFGYV